MRKNKLLANLAKIAVTVVVISGGLNIYEGYYLFRMDKKVDELLNKRKAEFTLEYQKYLDETAIGIHEIPVAQETTSRIRSDLMAKQSRGQFFLWLSKPGGEFVFGLPAPVFIRLNQYYDKYRVDLESGGFFVNRNHFLSEEAELSDNLGQALTPARVNRGVITSLRSLAEPEVPEGISTEVSLVLSASVFNSEQQIIGDLFLKVLRPIENPYRNDFLDEIFFPFINGLMGLSFAVLWFLLPSWVYMDARKRDVRRAFVWAVLTLLSLGFACIVYLLVRPQETKSFACPDCSGELNGIRAFCPHCGRDLSNTICRKCQYPLKPEWQFCPNCRHDTTSKAEPVEVSEES